MLFEASLTERLFFSGIPVVNEPWGALEVGVRPQN